MKKKYLLLFLLLLIAADQISKILIETQLGNLGEKALIPGFLNLVLVYNKGVAFGMMSQWDDSLRQLLLVAISIFATILLTWMYFKEYRTSRWGSFALCLIMSGAIGNAIDRLRVGKVVDFIDFFISTYHWPAFNFADSYICVGVCLLMLVKK